MNAAELLRHYERVADAPNAVDRLRRFVLDLAVRGRLVPQDGNDGPASKLLTTIAAEKVRLGICAAVVPLDLDEVPFPLPSGWSWSRVGDVCSKTGSGSTPRGGQAAYKSSGIPFLRSQNIYDDGLRLGDVAFIDADIHARMAGTQVRPKDLLLNITGGSIGRCCRVPDNFGEANVSQHVAILRPAVPAMSDYLHKLVLSPYFQWFVDGEQTGAGRGGLPKGRMDQIAVAVPPLVEQQRIVAKVDELMALCDTLEAARAEREAARDRLAAASLARLNAPDPESFDDHVRFALDALPALTARPNQIKHIRQTILTLAVRGLLQQQALPATDDGRSQLSSESGLPSQWRWARAEEVCEVIVDCPHSTPKFVPNGVVCLDTNAFKGGAILPAKVRYVTEQDYEVRTKRLIPRPRDIVLAREGSVGESVIVPDGMRCCLGQRVMLFRPSELLDSSYFQLALSEPSSLSRLLALHKGIGAKHVNVSDMRKALIPLPPLAEQLRIVAKVGQLMVLCDQLEASLQATTEHRSRLLTTLLRSALEPGDPTGESAPAEVLTAA